ncbi:MAG: hypothetical protein JST12_06215 [Armatimonadetes bacterium]|nr:hypothetical protein [Armatimonadota bacterium]
MIATLLALCLPIVAFEAGLKLQRAGLDFAFLLLPLIAIGVGVGCLMYALEETNHKFLGVVLYVPLALGTIWWFGITFHLHDH